ncbi:MAG: hypothetical protein ACOC6A_01435 [Chloroflexota bacterium]
MVRQDHKSVEKKTLDPDETRDLLLDFLYVHHKQARGVRAQEIKVSDLQRKMKTQHGLSAKEVAASLDYLVQKGWVREISRERSYTTPGGAVVPREQVTYKITDVGIDRLEGESRFKKQSPFGAVNIGNVQGAVVFGDHNVVNNQFIPLAEHLTRLEQAISTTAMPDNEKVAVIGDIETIKSQLAKPAPDRSILKRAWSAIEHVVTAHGFATILVETAKRIAPLIS